MSGTVPIQDLPGVDSATGGLLQQVQPDLNLYDDALDDFLQDLVVGIVGLNGNLVRPRFQVTPTQQPPNSTNWCAIGVMRFKPDDWPLIQHDGAANAGQGQDVMTRHEDLMLLASFYGPNATGNAAVMRDGLYVSQNREGLQLAGFALVGIGEPTFAPELINQQWYRRMDLPILLRREIVRVYPILNLLRVQGSVTAIAEASDAEVITQLSLPFDVEISAT